MPTAIAGSRRSNSAQMGADSGEHFLARGAGLQRFVHVDLAEFHLGVRLKLTDQIHVSRNYCTEGEIAAARNRIAVQNDRLQTARNLN